MNQHWLISQCQALASLVSTRTTYGVTDSGQYPGFHNLRKFKPAVCCLTESHAGASRQPTSSTGVQNRHAVSLPHLAALVAPHSAPVTIRPELGRDSAWGVWGVCGESDFSFPSRLFNDQPCWNSLGQRELIPGRGIIESARHVRPGHGQ